MTQDIFIGVDGGATKCKIRVEDSHGNVLGMAIGGPANIRLSVEGAWVSIYQTLHEILDAQHISLQDKHYRFHAGMGLAGCEVGAAYDAFLAKTHPFTTLHLVSDAHAACMGAHHGEDGAIIIVGTGVVGYQIQQGASSKVGGWGFPHDDEGGGAWLGLEAVRLTFQSIDSRVKASPLLEAVFDYFKQDLNAFVTWSNRATSHEFARLAPLVIQHSETEDPNAISLMTKAAEAVNLVGTAMNNLPCCLFGGIAPFLKPFLGASLRDRLVERRGDANEGAIRMVKQLL